MSGCALFLRRLERALAGGPQLPELSSLGWHEHLLACASCRATLESEEALEELLASMPDPKLPPELARRVLRRLRRLDPAAAGADLDALLELDAEPVLPAGLEARVLAGLAEARLGAPRPSLDELLDAAGEVEPPPGLAARVRARVLAELRLDALLEHDEVAPPAGLAGRVRARVRAERSLDRLLELDRVAVPEGLAARVLLGLEPAVPITPPVDRRTWRPRLLSGGRPPAPVRAAAAVLLAATGLALFRLVVPGPAAPLDGLAGMPAPSDDFLAALPVLEKWSVLAELDPSDWTLVGQFDVADELLLELGGGWARAEGEER